MLEPLVRNVNSVNSTVDPIPYRIRIGVTGHRTLPDADALAGLVKKAIDVELYLLFEPKVRERIRQAQKNNSPPIFYSVVSPLAEGADRLVSQVVLSYEGARLDAVLPLALEDYLEDFETPESKRQFEQMLDQCRRPVYLRRRRIQEDRHDPTDRAELRRSAYEAGGRFVVDHCDVIIALWDGKPSRGKGGTAEIVQYSLKQKRPVICVWDGVCQVIDRGSGLDDTALEGVNQFNRIFITNEKQIDYAANLDRQHFQKLATGSEVPEAAKELVRRYLFPYYVRASVVAKKSQKQFFRAGKFIYLLSALAVASVALAVLFEPISPLGFGAELALLSVMAWTLFRSHRHHSHETWMENRFLTERIRSGIFLAICGVETVSIEVPPYMGHAHNVNDWMVRVFGEIWNRLPRLAGCSHGHCLSLNNYVREKWIEDQVNFHRGKGDREHRARKRLETAASIVLPTTMVAALLHLIWPLLPKCVQAVQWIHGTLTFIAILFPAVAASLAGMQAHREYLRLEKRSRSMAEQLEKLNRQMASATEPAMFESLLQQVDEIMLRETQDWLTLMRYVEIKVG